MIVETSERKCQKLIDHGKYKRLIARNNTCPIRMLMNSKIHIKFESKETLSFRDIISSTNTTSANFESELNTILRKIIAKFKYDLKFPGQLKIDINEAKVDRGYVHVLADISRTSEKIEIMFLLENLKGFLFNSRNISCLGAVSALHVFDSIDDPNLVTSM